MCMLFSHPHCIIALYAIRAQRDTEQHPSSLVSNRCTFAACDDGNVAWTGATIKDDGFLNPGDEEVGTFTNYSVLHSSEPVKDNSLVPCIHCRNKYSYSLQVHVYSSLQCFNNFSQSSDRTNVITEALHISTGLF